MAEAQGADPTNDVVQNEETLIAGEVHVGASVKSQLPSMTPIGDEPTKKEPQNATHVASHVVSHECSTCARTRACFRETITFIKYCIFNITIICVGLIGIGIWQWQHQLNTYSQERINFQFYKQMVRLQHKLCIFSYYLRI